AECRQMRKDLEERNHAASGLLSRFWPHTRADTNHFKEVLDLLDRVEKALKRPAPAAPIAPAALGPPTPCAEVARAVGARRAPAPAWPPNWLVNLQAQTGDAQLIARVEPPAEDAPPDPGMHGLPPGSVARLLLLRQLVAALDAAGCAKFVA